MKRRIIIKIYVSQKQFKENAHILYGEESPHPDLAQLEEQMTVVV